MSEQKMRKPQDDYADKVVRILQKDIEGSMGLYPGLTKIKGVSWALSNATCKILKFEKTTKIGALTAEEITTIEQFLKNPQVPEYMKNRQKDFETGETKHLVSSDLELTQEFDIKRLKKIKSLRGFRHMVGLPSRGQRTKSNFRRFRSKGSGIKKKSK